MDLHARKLELIKAFLNVQSEDVLSKLEKIVRKESTISPENEFSSMSISEFNARIDQSMNDSREGKLTEVSQLKAEIEVWS